MSELTAEDGIQLDIDELTSFFDRATRPKVKKLLAEEIQKLNIHSLQASQPPSSEKVVENESIAKAKVSSAARKYYKDITNYAWDQSEKFMKIYITVNGVHILPKESVTAEFKSKSFMLKVENLDNQNYKCHVAYLYDSIVPAESYFKIKTDTVLLMLKKEKVAKTWAYVVERDDHKKKAPKFDEKKDANDSLMDLMKKMYDEGDDEMKRTIAKSFTESRNKVATEDLS